MERTHTLRAVAVAALIATTGCIDTFDGTMIEILFAKGTPVAGTAEPGAPPTGTHLELYVVKDDASFLISTMKLVPLIDESNPCYIEVDATYRLTNVSAAGLHVSQWYDKSLEVYQSDGAVDDDEAGALADALEREQAIADLAHHVKAVVSTPYGGMSSAPMTQADLDALAAALPPLAASDDEANRLRLELCQEFFAAHPDYYVGADRLITRPLNGSFYGVADGKDPRTGGFIGGATLIVDANIPDIDAMRVNWQFDDPDDPRAAALGNSTVGYHFMAGTPEQRTRGVVNLSLSNNAFTTISAEVAFFANLNDDNSHF